MLCGLCGPGRAYYTLLTHAVHAPRDVPMEKETSRPPMFSKLRESWSKVSHYAKEMVSVFSMSFLVVTVGQINVQNTLPPQWKVLRLISG